MKQEVKVSFYLKKNEKKKDGKSHTANEINRQLDEIRASALSHYRELSAVRENEDSYP